MSPAKYAHTVFPRIEARVFISFPASETQGLNETGLRLSPIQPQYPRLTGFYLEEASIRGNTVYVQYDIIYQYSNFHFHL